MSKYDLKELSCKQQFLEEKIKEKEIRTRVLQQFGSKAEMKKNVEFSKKKNRSTKLVDSQSLFHTKTNKTC